MRTPRTVLDAEETLSLTVGRVHQYRDCPRKFFYASLLHLPSQPSDVAGFGHFVHAIMEVFHRLALEAQTIEQLRRCVQEALGESPRHPERWLKHHHTLTWFDEQPALLKLDKRRQLHQAIEDLIAKGLPSQHAITILPEEPVVWGLPQQHTTFRLRIDLLFQEAVSQQWHILDYKVYGPKQFDAKSMDTLVGRLTHVLNGLPTNATDHRTRFFETVSKPLLYQMPLYWLASQYSASHKRPLCSFSLQIIRPAGTEAHHGCCRITVNGDQIEPKLATVIDDLITYIIEPIRQATHFQAAPERTICQSCDYRAICPQGNDST